MSRGRDEDFTVAEVASTLGVTPITVRVWITRGYLRRNARGKVNTSVVRAFIEHRDSLGRTFPADTPTAAD